ncbi:MAG TPA: hypothetical protein VFJ07_08360 [Streptosporangiaceae bacterium]|nr:hypothetical protein [Streptosporangiaceae bacterium]
MADVSPVVIRPLTEADLVDADRVFRVAFGTFLGAPDPRQFFGDAEFVRTRWHTDNDAAFAAVREGRLVGSNFVTNWAAWASSARSPWIRRAGTRGSPSC